MAHDQTYAGLVNDGFMKEKMGTYFIYGSLRRGCSNHHRFGFSSEAKFIRSAVLNGARMYDLGGYPCIVLTGNPEDLVHGELYALPEGKCRDAIVAMELGADYRTKSVLVDEAPAIVFVYEESPENARWIQDGDWRRPI